MTIQAIILLIKNEFIAELSDGRQIKQPEFRAMAFALYSAGVAAKNTQFEWRNGHRIMTAGQQVALTAEIVRLEREHTRLELAA